MHYSLRYDPDKDLVVLVFNDRVTIETVKEAAPQAARMSEERGCLRILIDMSAATIDVSRVDIFSSPGVMDESRMSRATKRALIVPSPFHNARFLESVTRNRGHNLMVFHDAEKAMRWLLDDVPVSPPTNGGTLL